MPARLLLVPAYLVIFATGAAGLIYQVTWHRYLSRLLGSDLPAAAVILAVFLGGLSLGYLICGKFTTRVKNHFRFYALLELTIGVWGLAFPWLFTLLARATTSWSFEPPLMLPLQGTLCSVLLMGLPCLCMGGTVPFLTSGLSRSLEGATRVHASVYSVNTLGAFLGALLAAFLLIPGLGLPGTLLFAAILNITGACFFLLAATPLAAPGQRAAKITTVTEAPEVAQPVPATGRPGYSPGLLYTVAFMNGFAVMSLENAFLRVTSLSLGSSAYSFAIVVAVFILSIAVGSLVVGGLRRVPPSLLCGSFLASAVLLGLVYALLDRLPYWAHLVRIAFQSNIVGFTGFYVALTLGLTVLLLPAAACMGASIPLAFHELKQSLPQVGKHSGLLFSWNTAGNLLGSLVGGILFYMLLDTDRVILAGVVMFGLAGFLTSFKLGKARQITAGGILVAGLALLVLSPLYDQSHFLLGAFRFREPLAQSLQGADAFFTELNKGAEAVFVEDGPTAMVAVLEDTEPTQPFGKNSMAVIINGKSDSSTLGDAETLRVISHLPALLAEKRAKVMVVGLGTGAMVRELALYPDVEQMDVVEISPEVVRALPSFAAFTDDLHLDPRFRLHRADAFRVLGRAETTWDIIVSEPSNPWVSGEDLLFTKEFYELARARLAEHGLFMHWFHTYAMNETSVARIVNTIRQVFPYLRVFQGGPGDMVVISAKRPLERADLLRAEQVLAGNPKARQSLREIGVNDLASLLAREVWSTGYIEHSFAQGGVERLDQPWLHYAAGKQFFAGVRFTDILTPGTWEFRKEYLLTQYLGDPNSPGLAPDSLALLLASPLAAKNTVITKAADMLWLRGDHHAPGAYGPAPSAELQGEADLIRAMADPVAAEQLLVQTGDFRQALKPMLAQKGKRTWLFTYPLDGLKGLLAQCAAQDQDPYLANWCVLETAALALTEDQDPDAAARAMAMARTSPDGQVPLSGLDSQRLNIILPLLSGLQASP